MESIGKLLNLARNKVHIKQKAMTEILCISTRTLQNYEADETEIPNSKLSVFAKHCNTTIDWILTGKGTDSNKVKEPVIEYIDRITKLESQLYRMGEVLTEIKKDNEGLHIEYHELKIKNDELRVLIALANKKGRSGSLW